MSIFIPCGAVGCARRDAGPIPSQVISILHRRKRLSILEPLLDDFLDYYVVNLGHDPWYLAFTVYPGITSFMDWGWLWAALFFAMLVLSAIDAEFAWFV